MLIDTFINAIFLYDDKMVITFNYKEGTKTITLAELPEAISNKNGSDLNCLVAPKNRTPLRGRPVFWYLRRTRKGGDSAAAAKMRPVDAFLAVGESLSFQAHPAFFICAAPLGRSLAGRRACPPCTAARSPGIWAGSDSAGTYAPISYSARSCSGRSPALHFS